ncbi:MAG: hypothetical protein U0169_15025 [Polyangiaceae bacterium]
MISRCRVRSFTLVLVSALVAPSLVTGCFVESNRPCDPYSPGGTASPTAPVSPGSVTADPTVGGGVLPGQPSDATGVYEDGGSGAGSADGAAPACEGRAVDPDKELFVVDSSVTASWRADVADPSASFSFRRIVTELAPANTTPSDFVLRWLESFATGNHVSFVANGSVSGTVAVAPRPRVSEVLVCPWLKLTPANGCDDTCGYCRGRALDLGKAPFALTAVVNRMDVRDTSRSCGADAGQGRLVFTALRPGTKEPIPFSVIFEYSLPSTTAADVRAWATRWHRLGDLPFGPAFASSLADVTDRFVRHGVLPSSSGGSALSAIRTNEAAFSASGTEWELREFRFLRAASTSSTYSLEPVVTESTPRLEVAGTEALGSHILANAASIRDRADNALPFAMIAGASSIPSASFAWSAPNVKDAGLLAAFNANTCNGCHARAGGVGAGGFLHVVPGATAGAASVRSPFLLGTGAGEGELARRATAFAAVLCSPCTGTTPYYGARTGEDVEDVAIRAAVAGRRVH